MVRERATKAEVSEAAAAEGGGGEAQEGVLAAVEIHNGSKMRVNQSKRFEP